MYTVPELTALLGLSTENQVRNRIEAIRGLLVGSIRRGPNNQLLVTEDGLRLLRDLQALCETGHTLTEAANIMRYKSEEEDRSRGEPSPRIAPSQAKPAQSAETGGWRALVEHLAAEVRDLAARVGALEARAGPERMTGAWWERWR
ncbi:MAG: hypothetical protein BIP78_0885 [Candidatus Bipolaricaulis sibiricus]|uniref:Uncharacterized protein n=1 Tax=Bipolaricaulis sibiricus TaxID=2501609 RepID=A0A410FUM6_BIPS1|nr:MAG: hypothetical protein BIP78_0885 [Candidatus Bipolaricaulis sibiricus]